MHKDLLRTSILSIALILPLAAQNQERQATLNGGGGDTGSCTIEISVDGVTEVEIRGDRASLRTLSGQPAQWRRFECTSRMPSNPADFKFSGVDGRGRQQLVREPQNGGATVVRIEDPAGGSEGYTFRLEWRGGSDFGAGRPDWRNPNSGPSGQQGSGSCEDAVRERAYQQFNTREIRMQDSNTADRRGRNGPITGVVEVRRGNAWNSYRYSCEMDFASQSVRSVQLTPVNDRRNNQDDRYSRTDEMSNRRGETDCQSAAEQRLQREGYQDVEVSAMKANSNRGRDRSISGMAKARRRGQNYEFNVVCPPDSRNGSVGQVQLNRQ